MSHQIHHTDAFILASYPRGESDRVVVLLSEEFGLVRGIATGVRKETSKLRYSLQPYTWSRVALVRGREVWRLTGASSHANVFAQVEHEDTRHTMMRIVNLVKRLVHGEGKNTALYQMFSSALRELVAHEYTGEELEAFECLVVLDILSALGYEPELADQHLVTLMSHDGYDTDRIQEALPHRKQMITHINEALEASQL